MTEHHAHTRHNLERKRLRDTGRSRIFGGASPGTMSADDAAGMTAAVQTALALGYRKFAFLRGPGVASDVRRRAAAAAGLELHGEHRMLVCESTGSGFEALAGRIVQDDRDLVLCFDDQRALKLLSALNRMDVRVPEDIGIIGFDDIPFAAISNPSLSTVAVPYERLGQLACRMLMGQLSSGVPAAPVRLDVQIVLRGTTAPHRQALPDRGGMLL